MAQSSFTTSAIAGTKRKRDAPKFYAVRIGKRPGIYSTWDECLDQVRGVKNASYKSFTTQSDAQNFIAAKDLATAGAIGQVKKWYGVQAGRNPGVYHSWLAVQDEISGFKGARYQGFKTRIEAEAFVAKSQQSDWLDTGDSSLSTSSSTAKKAKMSKTKGKDEAVANVDLADYAPGEAPLPEETEDGLDTAIILDESTGQARYRTKEERSMMKAQVARPISDSPVTIYTDGSSLGNGQIGAIAGVGVYFGPGDKRNVSQGLAGSRQTNQRAELTAILRALELAPVDRKVVIYSDSNYAINCVTIWFQKWRSNNWHNTAGKPVENKDLVTKIIDLLEQRYKSNKHRTHDSSSDPRDGGHWEKGPAGVKFVWVKGHAKDAGNNAADDLATSGAREAKELHRFASEDFI